MSRRVTSSVHVKNLANGVRHEELRRAFGKYGHLIDVTVPVDFHTGRSKGFAFVEFEDKRDAEDAIHYLNQTRLLGREISVEFTRGSRKTPTEMRVRDGVPKNFRDGKSFRGRNRSISPSRFERFRCEFNDRRDEPYRHRGTRDFEVPHSPRIRSKPKETSIRHYRKSNSNSPVNGRRQMNGYRHSLKPKGSPTSNQWRENRTKRPRSRSLSNSVNFINQKPGQERSIQSNSSQCLNNSPKGNGNSYRTSPVAYHRRSQSKSSSISPLKRASHSPISS